MRTKFGWMVFFAFWVILFIPVENSSSGEVFPTKPITLFAGYAPGGPADTTARAVASSISPYLAKPIVVLNKPGAGGAVAMDFVVNSKPDGYTLFNAPVSGLINAMNTRGVSWGPNELTAIAGYAESNLSIVVRSDAQWKNFDEWVQYVKKNPGFKYGDFGALGVPHIVMEWIAKKFDLKLVAVHFNGDAQGLIALLGGHIEVFGGGGAQGPQISAGKLRTLLQLTGEPVDSDPKSVTRLKDIPGAPMDLMFTPFGIYGPKGIPETIQVKLSGALREGTKKPEFGRVIGTMNMEVKYYDQTTLHKSLIKSYEAFREVTKELGLEKK
jgi:tripartite-type tricarboxylate transporter receptor subunit TctC